MPGIHGSDKAIKRSASADSTRRKAEQVRADRAVGRGELTDEDLDSLMTIDPYDEDD